MKPTELQLLTGSMTPQATHAIDKHLEGYYTIQLMTTGGVELFYDDRRYLLEGSWFWPAYPGPRIRFHVAPGYPYWEHRYIAFRGPLVQQWVNEGLFSPDPQPARPDMAYGPLFDKLLAQMKQTGYWSTRRALHLLEGLLIDLAEERAQDVPRYSWVQEVLEHFKQQEANFPPDYEQLARQYHMSVSSLRRQFRQETGMPIHSYVLQCRIAWAQSLLAETVLPMNSIARRLGYSDVYYFSRQFHECVGMSPTAYRQRQRL